MSMTLYDRDLATQQIFCSAASSLYCFLSKGEPVISWDLLRSSDYVMRHFNCSLVDTSISILSPRLGSVNLQHSTLTKLEILYTQTLPVYFSILIFGFVLVFPRVIVINFCFELERFTQWSSGEKCVVRLYPWLGSIPTHIRYVEIFIPLHCGCFSDELWSTQS